MFLYSPMAVLMAKWVLLHCSVYWLAITVVGRRLNFLKLDRAAPMTIERAPIEALQQLQLDLWGRVEPAMPFKSHDSTAI